MPASPNLQLRNDYLSRARNADLYSEAGTITHFLGLGFEAYLPGASVGSVCRIYRDSKDQEGVEAEVVGFRNRHTVLIPFENASGISNGSRVVVTSPGLSPKIGEHLLGRVINARGEPIDGRGPLLPDKDCKARSLYEKPMDPVQRRLVNEPIDLGIRSINGLLSCGKGQRVGIFAGSGVGKSVLLGQMARHTAAQVNVIGLVGERGREVREFIERDLGPEGLAKSVVVVATSDATPILRTRAAHLAATVAEYFRDDGKDVLLLMDSITRLSMSQREIGLAMGEPPATKGYPPSVFSNLPQLLERAGTSTGSGSITGIFTVLVEGDEMDDPIADAARSFLDGHIVLSRRLAERGLYPAVDVLQSGSRVMPNVVDSAHLKWAIQVKQWIALYENAEDLINIGAYVKGSNPALDMAVQMYPRIEQYLRQEMNERSDFSDAQARTHALIRSAEGLAKAAQGEESAGHASPR